MARICLIANPVSGRSTPEAILAVWRTLAAAGWSVELVETTGHGDARRLAALAVEDGVDTVAVFGGDGTSMQAATALVGTGVRLGLLPGGTGNVLAGNLRIPPTPVQAAQLITRGLSRRMDLGRIERADGIHYFGVACGAGADALVMGETATTDKRRLGIGGYWQTLFRVLPKIRSSPYRVTVDGVTRELMAAVVLTLNCGEIIPPVRVHPNATLDDGLFDVMVLAADTPWQVFRGMGMAFANVLFDVGGTSFLHYARGRSVTIEASEPDLVQFDGDLAGHTPVSVEVCPGALDVIAPVL